MKANRKPTLVMLLFPLFETSEARKDFERFLRDALVVTETEIRVLEHQPRYTPVFVHAFLKTQTQGWDGDTALICFAGQESILQAASKIGTLDQFVPRIRAARKVLVTRPLALEQPAAMGYYPSVDDRGAPVNKPLFMLRTGPPPYPIAVMRELANFLGTRDRPRVPTDTFKAAMPREDETMRGLPIEDPRTGKVTGLRPSTPDARCRAACTSRRLRRVRIPTSCGAATRSRRSQRGSAWPRRI